MTSPRAGFGGYPKCIDLETFHSTLQASYSGSIGPPAAHLDSCPIYIQGSVVSATHRLIRHKPPCYGEGSIGALDTKPSHVRRLGGVLYVVVYV